MAPSAEYKTQPDNILEDTNMNWFKEVLAVLGLGALLLVLTNDNDSEQPDSN